MSEIQNNMKNKDFCFTKVLENTISDLPNRSREIVWSRYGVSGSQSITLEEIGRKFSITRERVRQVVREVCKKIKAKSESSVLAQVREKIIFTMQANNGIMKTDLLLESLGGKSNKEKGAIRFFLTCLPDVKDFEIKGVTEKALVLGNFVQQEWINVKDEVKNILEKKKSPINEKILFEEFVKTSCGEKIDKKKLLDYLNVSRDIKKNVFGKWGISKWKEINPKGTGDKAYLILKEKRESMHFKDIAKEIDKNGLNRKKTHPQTVHNELIKDKKFVLVGRGIYALAEWGYEKGTVRDVLRHILENNRESLSRDEIIDKVLEVRQVKKSTVIINLNNYFKKTKEGRYMNK